MPAWGVTVGGVLLLAILVGLFRPRRRHHDLGTVRSPALTATATPMRDEWMKVISGNRVVKFTYFDLPEGAVFYDGADCRS